MKIKVFSDGLVVRATSDNDEQYNAVMYANIIEHNFKARFSEVSEHKLISTFYFDLSIAEYYGEAGIRETYANVIKSWADNYKYFAEFVLCLNWKIWAWHSAGCDAIARIYDELWKQADELIWERYEGNEEACSYIFRVLD